MYIRWMSLNIIYNLLNEMNHLKIEDTVYLKIIQLNTFLHFNREIVMYSLELILYSSLIYICLYL